MDDNIITEKLYELVKQRIESTYKDVTVEKTDVVKNNGVSLTGVTIRNQADSIAPTIYLNGYVDNIQSGLISYDASVQEVMDSYEMAVKEKPEWLVINHENAKSSLYATVINRDKNEELLKTIPHRDIEDLSVVARYRVSDHGSFLVTNNACGLLGMEPSEVIEYAEKNSIAQSYSVKSMGETLVEMMPDMPDDVKEEIIAQQNAASPMVVITNKEMTYGAVGPFISEDLRAEIRDKIGGEFYILPSSIHECIAVSADSINERELAEMIQSVNMTEVADTEILSNSPYFVSADLKLSLAGQQSSMKVSESLAENISEGKHMTIKM